MPSWGHVQYCSSLTYVVSWKGVVLSWKKFIVLIMQSLESKPYHLQERFMLFMNLNSKVSLFFVVFQMNWYSRFSKTWVLHHSLSVLRFVWGGFLWAKRGKHPSIGPRFIHVCLFVSVTTEISNLNRYCPNSGEIFLIEIEKKKYSKWKCGTLLVSPNADHCGSVSFLDSPKK